MKKNIIKIITGLLFILFFSACVKEDFDTTPEYVTDWVANTTIADLKAKYSNMPVTIDTDIVIKGVVISDDENGNFYKELFIEDETGGIGIELDESHLFEKYPVGKKVYIKCKGLSIGLDYDVPKLGLGLNINRINRALIEDYVDVSAGGSPVEPKVINLADANGNNIDSMIGSFIRLENVQFINPDTIFIDTGKPYTERTITDCSGNTMVISTSSYAEFGLNNLPGGNGTLDAVLSKYRGAYQLRLNTDEDINFNNSRCTK